jgi:hypothetical protein
MLTYSHGASSRGFVGKFYNKYIRKVFAEGLAHLEYNTGTFGMEKYKHTFFSDEKYAKLKKQ